MQQLTDALVAQLPASSIRHNSAAQSIRPVRSGWQVSVTGDSQAGEDFDGIVLATPAYVAGSLLQTSCPDLASELTLIPYTSSVTINLGYGNQVRRSLPAGFGFLIPRSEKKRMLATTFVHNKFPHRAPADRALLRCFLGGSRDAQAIDLTADEITGIIRTELQQILGITAAPEFVRIHKWRNAMAQYTVGHLEKLDRISNLLQHLPGLSLAGNGYRGIGVPDCARSGTEAAETLVTLGLAPQPATC